MKLMTAAILTGLVIASSYLAISVVRMIREVNEPNPDTFPISEMEHRIQVVTGYGCKLSKVIYVNRDDEIYIALGHFEPKSKNVSASNDRIEIRILPSGSEFIIGVTRFEDPSETANRKQKFEQKWKVAIGK
ncbi:MAG TPA: hypothetical protein VK171_11895 [Fimbriimonas sp.]|nr:hypothetical protein [Fimbriimonas sp.]